MYFLLMAELLAAVTTFAFSKIQQLGLCYLQIRWTVPSL